MSDVAVLIADMVRAGVDPDLIGRTAEALASREPVVLKDESAERRRMKDRDRKRLRNSAEVGGTTPPFPPDGVSPGPPSPKPSNPVPPSPPKGGSSPAERSEFAEFWALFPNKVGKGAAEKSFQRARRKVAHADLIAGLRRYVAKTDDRPWCNPATWLNQERWTDQPMVQGPVLSVVEDEATWRRRLNAARLKSQWDVSGWGPMPGQAGCRAPPGLLDPTDGRGWSEWKAAA